MLGTRHSYENFTLTYENITLTTEVCMDAEQCVVRHCPHLVVMPAVSTVIFYVT
jgi:hypothetical protein